MPKAVIVPTEYIYKDTFYNRLLALAGLLFYVLRGQEAGGQVKIVLIKQIASHYYYTSIPMYRQVFN